MKKKKKNSVPIVNAGGDCLYHYSGGRWIEISGCDLIGKLICECEGAPSGPPSGLFNVVRKPCVENGAVPDTILGVDAIGLMVPLSLFRVPYCVRVLLAGKWIPYVYEVGSEPVMADSGTNYANGRIECVDRDNKLVAVGRLFDLRSRKVAKLGSKLESNFSAQAKNAHRRLGISWPTPERYGE